MAVECSYVNEAEEENFDIGANPSELDAEEGAGGAGGGSDASKILDVVKAFKLNETSYDKKSYMSAVKEYMGKLKKKLEEKNPTRVDTFMKGAQNFVKEVLASFDEYSFYCGESYDPEGMIILCRFFTKDGADGQCKITPVLYYFKDGLKEEKC